MPGANSSLRDGAAAAEEAAYCPDTPSTHEIKSPQSGGHSLVAEAPAQSSSPPQPVVDAELQPPESMQNCSSVTDAGSDLSSQRLLDVPLEEVLKQATEAFGQIASALSSTKWDRRVQALKGVTTVLKGLDIKVATPMGQHNRSLTDETTAGGARGLQLRDHARCFHAACLILNIVMRDKVLPVLLAAHELYRVAFEHSKAFATQAEAFSSADALFPHILGKLGELNIRLHESACACVLFTATQPFFGTSLVLARLLDVVEGRGAHQAAALRGQQKMRVHSGVLQAVEMLIKKSPARRDGEGDAVDAVATWTPADVAPFIASGLQADSVTGARVQQASLGLAMHIYMTLGKAALSPVLQQLSPAAKDLLVSRLDQEGEDIEDLDGGDGDEDCIELTGADSLCIMGVGLRPQPDLSVAKPNTTDNEECFMDEILEDTGMVMDGKGFGKKHAQQSALDEELLDLGLDDLEQLATATSLPDGTRWMSKNKQALLS